MSYSNPMGDQVGWESGAEAGMPRTPAPPFYDPTMPPLIEPPVILDSDIDPRVGVNLPPDVLRAINSQNSASMVPLLAVGAIVLFAISRG